MEDLQSQADLRRQQPVLFVARNKKFSCTVAGGIVICSDVGCSGTCSTSGCSGATSVVCSASTGFVCTSVVCVIDCSVVGSMGNTTSAMVGLVMVWLGGEEIS